MNLFTRMAACIFAAATVTLAQGPQGTAGSKEVPLNQVQHLNRAPVSKEVLHVSLPRPYETTLANGLTVLILEDHRLPFVSVQLAIYGAGGIHDPVDRPGLAVTTAQMMTLGSADRSATELAAQEARYGASIGVGSGFGGDLTTVSASGLSDNFDQWFGLATEVLLHPSFPSDELDKLKQRTLLGLRQSRTSPGFLATERFNRAVYADLPPAVISATEVSVNAMTVEDLRRWHDTRFDPANSILAIAGDVTPSDLVPKLRAAFASWKKLGISQAIDWSPAPAAAKKIYLVDRPNSVQTTLYLGNIFIARDSPDWYTYVVMNQVFGAGPQSRLFTNLREQKGYTYGVYSTLPATKYASAWRAYGDVRTAVTDGSMTEFMNEIGRIRNEPVGVDELDQAKKAIVAGFARSLENPTGVLSAFIAIKHYNFPADYWDAYPARIMAASADDVQKFAQKYMNPNAMQIVAVGDAKQIRSVMEKYGPVEVWGVDGRPEAAPSGGPKR